MLFGLFGEICGAVDTVAICSCLHSVSQLVCTWLTLAQRSCLFLSPHTGHLRACLPHSTTQPHMTPAKRQELSRIPLGRKHVGQVSLQGQTQMRALLSGPRILTDTAHANPFRLTTLDWTVFLFHGIGVLEN